MADQTEQRQVGRLDRALGQLLAGQAGALVLQEDTMPGEEALEQRPLGSVQRELGQGYFGRGPGHGCHHGIDD